MSNKEKFRETFEQVEISKEVLGEIECLETKGRRKSYIKPVIAFAMMCALVLLTGKAVFDYTHTKEKDEVAIGKIYYAAEKEEEEEDNYNFVELPKEVVELKKENVMVNNDELSKEVVEHYVDDEGFYCYKFQDDSSASILVEKPEHTSVLMFRYETNKGGNSGLTLCFEGEVTEVAGRIYLRFNPYEKARDITEDFQNGVASERFYYEFEGVYERVKAILEYRVEGTVDNYSVDVWFVEE